MKDTDLREFTEDDLRVDPELARHREFLRQRKEELLAPFCYDPDSPGFSEELRSIKPPDKSAV